MTDCVVIGIALVFFALSIGMIKFFDSLSRSD